LIKNLSLELKFPSSFHAQKGFLYTTNNNRKEIYEQKQAMTVIIVCNKRD